MSAAAAAAAAAPTAKKRRRWDCTLSQAQTEKSLKVPIESTFDVPRDKAIDTKRAVRVSNLKAQWSSKHIASYLDAYLRNNDLVVERNRGDLITLCMVSFDKNTGYVQFRSKQEAKNILSINSNRKNEKIKLKVVPWDSTRFAGALPGATRTSASSKATARISPIASQHRSGRNPETEVFLEREPPGWNGKKLRRFFPDILRQHGLLLDGCEDPIRSLNQVVGGSWCFSMVTEEMAERMIYFNGMKHGRLFRFVLRRQYHFRCRPQRYRTYDDFIEARRRRAKRRRSNQGDVSNAHDIHKETELMTAEERKEGQHSNNSSTTQVQSQHTTDSLNDKLDNAMSVEDKRSLHSEQNQEMGPYEPNVELNEKSVTEIVVTHDSIEKNQSAETQKVVEPSKDGREVDPHPTSKEKRTQLTVIDGNSSTNDIQVTPSLESKPLQEENDRLRNKIRMLEERLTGVEEEYNDVAEKYAQLQATTEMQAGFFEASMYQEPIDDIHDNVSDVDRHTVQEAIIKSIDEHDDQNDEPNPGSDDILKSQIDQLQQDLLSQREMGEAQKEKDQQLIDNLQEEIKQLKTEKNDQVQILQREKADIEQRFRHVTETLAQQASELILTNQRKRSLEESLCEERKAHKETKRKLRDSDAIKPEMEEEEDWVV